MEKPGQILVVDDQFLNRKLLVDMLELLGHQSEEARDGFEALEKVSNNIDLVLLDVQMPGMDGIQVLSRIKADAALRHIPVVMISALSDLGTIVKCIEIGADDYLPKPFHRTLLNARVNACLEKKRLYDRERLYLQQIEAEKSRFEEEKRRSDELLHVIFPDEIVQELKISNRVKPRLYQDVAVLFCDIVGFTPYCAEREPEDVISHLQELIEVYEEITLRYGMQKIKTIGDSFMSAAGLLKPLDNPALNSVRCGLEMIAAARKLSARWTARVGIHFGPVMAGVVGCRQYLFDLWGDTVNTAARIESHGVNDSVNVSDAVWAQVSPYSHGESLGLIPLKGKGEMEIFRVWEY